MALPAPISAWPAVQSLGLQQLPCGSSLAADAICFVGVAFNPQAAGTPASLIRIVVSKANSVTNFTVPVTGLAVTGFRFVPVTPCRIADTRNPSGSFGGPILSGNVSRDFVIPASACGIPATATTYSLNATVVPTGVLGFLTLWPTGQTRPLVLTLNSNSRIKANAAIVTAGTNGAVSVYLTQDTHLVLDINGYFVDVATSPSSLSALPTPEAHHGSPALFWPLSPAPFPFSPADYLQYGHRRRWRSSTSTACFFRTVRYPSTHLVLDVFGYFAP